MPWSIIDFRKKEGSGISGQVHCEMDINKRGGGLYQSAFNRMPRRRGGMKKAEAEVEAKKFLNLDLNLNLPFPGSRMKANWY